MLRESDFKNHRIFTLRCINRGIVLVSIRLRSENSKLSKGTKEIIYKAEKQLLQDRVSKVELASMVTTIDRVIDRVDRVK